MTTGVASPRLRHYCYAMSEELAEAVRQALDAVPGSDRELAIKAGVPQSTVSRIRTGERGCTPEVAAALAEALGSWASDCREAESDLRRALEREENR